MTGIIVHFEIAGDGEDWATRLSQLLAEPSSALRSGVITRCVDEKFPPRQLTKKQRKKSVRTKKKLTNVELLDESVQAKLRGLKKGRVWDSENLNLLIVRLQQYASVPEQVALMDRVIEEVAGNVCLLDNNNGNKLIVLKVI
jgi:hypothetical protein